MITETKNRPFEIPHVVTHGAAWLWPRVNLERFFVKQTGSEVATQAAAEGLATHRLASLPGLKITKKEGIA